ncbi:gp53-like domain-containing protein [Desulfurobacterium indicum]|uniref:Tail fiber protein n=1 Tax=Desulfurobacterium indicum TaxID=1914305 RepID=A0A1R1MKD9_9BACT|nr:phage tail protein [Desulfurobacterium indicum]OMH40229.1 hypothetical protein BLW93_06375 [Desulfurobacterium indicum]
MAEGKTVITLNGLKALTEASTLGRQVKPVYFKVSDQDIGDIYPGIDIDDLSGVWYQANISGYISVNDSTVQFILDIPEESATKYGKVFGLYLEDGTLFAVAVPPYPFPPLMRQRFKVQFVWQQIDSVMNFEDIPFYEFDQDVVHLDAISTISLALFDVQEHLIVLEQFKADYYRFKSGVSERLQNHEERISANKYEIEAHENAILDTSSTLSEQVLSLSEVVGLIPEAIAEAVKQHNTDTESHPDIRQKISSLSLALSSLIVQDVRNPGWMKIGNLLIEWGSVANNGNGGASVVFPKPYSEFVIPLLSSSQANSPAHHVYVANLSLESMGIAITSSDGAPNTDTDISVYWLSIGR